MAYDPQASRRRPRPAAEDPAPVDAILGKPTEPPSPTATPDDPPPTPAVTPAPADPPSDTLLLSSGVVTAIGAVVALLTLRHLWNRRKRRAAGGSTNEA